MNTQRGAALLMGLLLLLVLTMMAVASVNMSTINLRIVNNMQAAHQTDVGIRQAIEQALINPGEANYFTSNKATEIQLPVAGLGDVTVKPRKCLYSEFIGDTSAGVTPGELAVWEVSATYTDPVTNATTEIVQGVRIVMEGNGNCL